MNGYTFKGTYGDYTFSDKQIESNPYLNNKEKSIMHGLANGQSAAIQRRKEEYLSSSKPKTSLYEYSVDDTKGRRTLEKRPVEFSFDLDYSKKRWYESNGEFLSRMVNKEEKKRTVRTKEVRRDNINVERSTFGDGTEITKWDKQTRLFY